MQAITEPECVEVVSKWKANPIVRHYSFSNKRIWPKQEEILWAPKKHKRTCIKSGNTIGKSFIAADLTLDWLITHHPARVITTAPTFDQVETIIWKEIRKAYFSAKIPIGGEILNTTLKLDEDWFAEGISTNDVSRFQGRHNEHLLVIIDEASGITEEIWDTVEALHPEAIVAIGNPVEPNGRFAESFQSHLWHQITVSCIDCVEWQRVNGKIPGLVTLEWINDMADLHGTGSDWYRVHVLGEFPAQTEDALISRLWVDRARKGLDCDGIAIDDEIEADEARIISVDPATKHGNCETVVGYRYGHTPVSLTAYRKATMTFVRDQIQALYSKREAHIVGVDSDGLGEPMAELLSESYVPSLDFHGGYGAKAMDQTRFKNLRTQFYYIVAKKFEKGLYNLKHMPQKDFEMLRDQLCSIKVKKADALGRTQIETKEDMAARQIKSPDYADAFMIGEYCFFMRKHAEVQPTAYGPL